LALRIYVEYTEIAMPALSLRISDKDRKLIDKAADALSKSRTEFMLDSARAAAADTLLDQRLFVLGPAEFRKFERALEKAPAAADVLAKLKSRPVPWKT
jgi:uncharacterized protein (DUF1778 family)